MDQLLEENGSITSEYNGTLFKVFDNVKIERKLISQDRKYEIGNCISQTSNVSFGYMRMHLG